jgi:nardilysin
MVPRAKLDNAFERPPDAIKGPDLNPTRGHLDKKLYRQILLPNGLRCLLVEDVLAAHNSSPLDYEEEEDDDVSEDRVQEKAGDSDEEDSWEDEPGLRNAAACMVVGAGSIYDPKECQGLAHFLEHLLFMGSEKYPEENDYDAFVSKRGGSDNAWTEWEYTSYSLDIPQDSLWPALDRLAQFFIAPLMLQSAVDRELLAIESEFQLRKNSDSARWEQLLCATCDPQNPMRK